MSAMIVILLDGLSAGAFARFRARLPHLNALAYGDDPPDLIVTEMLTPDTVQHVAGGRGRDRGRTVGAGRVKCRTHPLLTCPRHRHRMI